MAGLPVIPSVRVVRHLRNVRTTARALFVIGILSGISYITTTIQMSPEQFALASDVYITATEAWLAGEDPYDVWPERLPGYQFLYPPILLLVFVPHTLAGSTGAYAIQTALNIGFAIAITVILRRALRRRDVELAPVDLALVFGFVLLSPYGMPQLIQGQTTMWLGLAFVAGFDLLDSRRHAPAGAVFAAAAIVKVFPAAIGLWLLRLRAWRGVITAVGTGLLALAIGAIALGPDLTVQYFTEVLVERYEGQTFDGPLDPYETRGGIRRQLSALFALPASLMTPVAIAILAPMVAICYRDIGTDIRKLTAILATIVAVLLFMPLQPLYFPLVYFPVVVLLYRLEHGLPRWLLLVGVAATFVMVKLESYERTVAAFPEWIESPLLLFGEAFFSLALPPDVGMWLMMAACLTVHLRSE